MFSHLCLVVKCTFTFLNFKIEIKTSFLKMLVLVEEKIGNPQTLNDVGEVTEEAAVKPANNKYSSMRNGYEITFNQNTAV